MTELPGTVRLAARSQSPYESQIGFSRAIRVGDIIAVSGTAPLGPDGRTVGLGDAAVQARRCFVIIREALEQLGAGLRDVVRTRVLLTNIDHWREVAAVHAEFFREPHPACTFVQVHRFVEPHWLVEIEADAVAPPARD